MVDIICSYQSSLEAMKLLSGCDGGSCMYVCDKNIYWWKIGYIVVGFTGVKMKTWNYAFVHFLLTGIRISFIFISQTIWVISLISLVNPKNLLISCLNVILTDMQWWIAIGVVGGRGSLSLYEKAWGNFRSISYRFR